MAASAVDGQPDQFIALAEETGQIVSLGSWVLSRATADIARWRRDPGQEPRALGVPARDGAVPGGGSLPGRTSA